MNENPDVPIGELFTQLVDDGKRYAHAEVALYRAKIADRAVAARSALLLALVAMLLGQAATVGLIVGLILWLAPMLGPMGSTLTVVVATLLVAALLGYLAMRSIQSSTAIQDPPR